MATGVICGMGEVGKALQEVLSRKHKVYGVDVGMSAYPVEPVDVLHICFPCNNSEGALEAFELAVEGYIKQFSPKYTVIHSTVPVGTCKRLGVYHSPVRGIHPYLTESILTFWVYLAPRNNEILFYFKDCGMNILQIPNTDETEAGKLWSLAKLAWDVAFEKEVYRWCLEYDLDWKIVYKNFTQTYNEGYEKMGFGQYIRPVLDHVDGGLGGHCVVPALEKLAPESELAQHLLGLNAQW